MIKKNEGVITERDFTHVLNSVEKLVNEVSKEIVGQGSLVESLIIALISDGHLLIEGVPGLAKTRAVKTMSAAMGGSWNRVQFTPDLLPSDLTGQRIFNQGNGSFDTELGPIMCNFLLADEINRAPAKVQSALLECMEERQVTINSETFSLPKPFQVLATMNPFDSDGTYNLPSAQLDRFLLRVRLTYPSIEEELEIVRRSLTQRDPLNVVLTLAAVLKMQELRSLVYVPKTVASYAVQLVRATRSLPTVGLDKYSDFVTSGAGVRASLFLVTAAQSKALISGRTTVEIQDIVNVSESVVAHRMLMNYQASMEGVTSQDIISMIVKSLT